MRGRLIGLVAVLVVAIAAVTYGLVGGAVFADASADRLRPADAIVVLGGEHDGREQYGLDLARRGLASTVLISDPYGRGDDVTEQYCRARIPGVEVICFEPDPSTTRGEAGYVERLASERGWKHVIAISWRYHLPRVRHIFGQCFGGEVTAVDTPRDYRFSAAQWGFVYAYQIAGYIKSEIVGCR
ncbi:YdcF family protein [Gordonia soli]|uniref:DUF218 domain-containing protein n=1 Tax=Gordonia soli NBRC 108243 TaxID=1223545 RepID=M0QKL3_9ACTN|nr:YdcF family protein [Gordonia soli]GAC67957.1 hypothetical protein GS4_11_02260 [Gordonia soli NBRC 108243]